MPRNAQWTPQEDQELTKLTLNNSKQNNGNLDWDQIHDLRMGQIARRSKNAMISRWWKIKERQDYDINDDDNNDNMIQHKTNNDNHNNLNNVNGTNQININNIIQIENENK